MISLSACQNGFITITIPFSCIKLIVSTYSLNYTANY